MCPLSCQRSLQHWTNSTKRYRRKVWRARRSDEWQEYRPWKNKSINPPKTKSDRGGFFPNPLPQLVNPHARYTNDWQEDRAVAAGSSGNRDAGGGKSELRRAVCRITSGTWASKPMDGQCHRKDTASATPPSSFATGQGHRSPRMGSPV